MMRHIKHLFPSSICAIIVLCIISMVLTAFIMVIVPIDELLQSMNLKDGYLIGNYALVYICLIIMIVCSWAVNKVRKNECKPYRHGRLSIRSFIFSVTFVLWLHIVLATPLGILFGDITNVNRNQSTIMILFLVICSPILEEIVFRGVFLNGLSQRYLPLISVLISSLLFALFHFDLSIMLSTFLIGISLGIVYFISNRNIISCIIAHSACNFLTLCGLTKCPIYNNQWIILFMIVAGVGSLVLVLLYYKKNISYSNTSKIETTSLDCQKLVTIAEYSKEIEADMIVEMLNANGIKAVTIGSVHTHPYFNAIDPIKVMVNAADCENASRLINRTTK